MQEHLGHERVKLVKLAIISGIAATMISLIYSYRWATLTSFNQGSSGTGYGYPFSFIGYVSVGQAPPLAFTVSNSLYMAPLYLFVDFAVWISVAFIIAFSVFTLKFDKRNGRRVYYSLGFTLAALLVSLVLNFDGSNMPVRGAPLPYLEYGVNTHGWSLVTDPPFIYGGIIIPNLFFDLCFLYVLFLVIFGFHMSRKMSSLSGN